MKKHLTLLLVILVVIFLDQSSKWWILHHLPIGEEISVIPNYFEIVHVRNQGAAFGFLSQWESQYRSWFFYALSLIATALLLQFYYRAPAKDMTTRIALAVILGGALGNLLDRLQHGEVVDFLHFHWQNKIAHFNLFHKDYTFLLSWPAFNVADMAISCGAVLFALSIAFAKSPQDKEHS